MLSHRLSALALALLAAPAAFGQDCGGKPGWHLDAPTTLALGSSYTVTMTGPADEMGLFMVSGGQGPIYSKKYGWICLDFPTLIDLEFMLDATGTWSFSGDVDCDPELVGITIYSQFITCAPNAGASNQVATTIVDGFGVGDLCTYTQGGWGAKCSGNNPGCLRDREFCNVFPHGLSIGDPDGDDCDRTWALELSKARDVDNFLPAGGTPAELSKDEKNPTKKSSAGVFAGQLVAAKLNVAFDDAGKLDDCKNRDDLKLGDLVFVGGVDADLIGWKVRDVLDLAEQAISGALGKDGFDLDGDGKADVTIADLNQALDVLNNNFDGGCVNQGNLGLGC